MNLSRLFKEEMIKLEMETVIEPPEEGNTNSKWLLSSKETILSELVDLLEIGARVGNRTKFLLDFVNREKKATTGIGYGIAIPHVRSLQAKEFMIGFARSAEGYDFGSLDGEPVHLFFAMAAPPYDDAHYLKVFKELATVLQYESVRAELKRISSPGELIRVFRSAE